MFSEADLPPQIRYLVTDRKTLMEAQREGRLWVALNARREAVGFAHACVIDDEAHLDEMDVLPDYGRRGIGTALLKKVEAWAVDAGYDALTLITFRHLPWNAPFYAALGYDAVGEQDLGDEMSELLREEADAGLDATKRICMRKYLP